MSSQRLLTNGLALVKNAGIMYQFSQDKLEEPRMVDSAELFEVISHPVRIKILKILEKQPASFASLKRQLDIDSSGNLDHHLKKLGQLIAVRNDGLYNLSDAGKEALLSVQAIELWGETERRKTSILGKVPGEAFFLALLEFCTAVASTFWIFTAFGAVAMNEYFSGFLLSVIVALLGFSSAFGVFTGKRWSWKTVIVKSTLMMLGSLIPLCYLSVLLGASGDVSSQITQFYTTGVFYATFVGAEVIAVFLALRRSVKDFLGVKPVSRLPRRALLGGVTSIISGILAVIGGSVSTFSSGPNGSGPLFVLSSFMFGGGLAVGIGGALVLLRSYTLGALMTIIFCLFPYPTYSAALTVVGRFFGSSITAIIAALVIGLLPIVGGILALVSIRKILD